jgi:hypothetical protein
MARWQLLTVGYARLHRWAAPRAQNARPVAAGAMSSPRPNAMTRIQLVLAAAALLSAATVASAEDRRYDPKALARYDVSYVRCEASFPEMKGHRDEAYMSLWRMKPGPKTEARMAEVRGSTTYKSEQRLAKREAAGASGPDAVKALEQQCRGLWGEMKKTPKPKA